MVKGRHASSASLSLVIFLFFRFGSFDSSFSDFVENDLVGIDECLLKIVGESVESRGTDGLVFVSSLGSLGLDSLGAVGNSLDNGSSVSLGLSVSVGVESLHHSLVLERVSLGLVVEFVVGNGNSDGSKLSLNLVSVDDSGEIGAVDDIALHGVAGLSLSLGSVGSEDGVKRFEGITGEDDEASDGTTGSELEEVESVDVADINTGQVAGGLLDVVVGVSVDDEGSSSVGETSISVLSLSSSHSLGLAHALEISLSAKSVEG